MGFKKCFHVRFADREVRILGRYRKTVWNAKSCSRKGSSRSSDKSVSRAIEKAGTEQRSSSGNETRSLNSMPGQGQRENCLHCLNLEAAGKSMRELQYCSKSCPCYKGVCGLLHECKILYNCALAIPLLLVMSPCKAYQPGSSAFKHTMMLGQAVS